MPRPCMGRFSLGHWDGQQNRKCPRRGDRSLRFALVIADLNCRCLGPCCGMGSEPIQAQPVAVCPFLCLHPGRTRLELHAKWQCTPSKQQPGKPDSCPSSGAVWGCACRPTPGDPLWGAGMGSSARCKHDVLRCVRPEMAWSCRVIYGWLRCQRAHKRAWEPTLSVLLCSCLQPYLAKADGWRNGAQVRLCRSLVGRLDADSR